MEAVANGSEWTQPGWGNGLSLPSLKDRTEVPELKFG